MKNLKYYNIKDCPIIQSLTKLNEGKIDKSQFDVLGNLHLPSAAPEGLIYKKVFDDDYFPIATVTYIHGQWRSNLFCACFVKNIGVYATDVPQDAYGKPCAVILMKVSIS